MNQRTIDMIVVAMALMGISAIGAAVYLVSVNQPVPDPLWQITGGVIVGLPALLASIRSGAGGPAPVVVQNDGPDEAIPVEEA